MATPQPDPRLEQLVELVVQLASGELSVRLPPSPASDAIDAVIVGINMLAEELEALNKHLEGRVAERTASSTKPTASSSASPSTTR
jgi:nitrate/nitrite-specific signal transduction histidine kinase